MSKPIKHQNCTTGCQGSCCLKVQDLTVVRGDEVDVYKRQMVMTAIKVGKRPLQGTKLLVRIASSRSRGESMIRHPTTPAALQPKPMHMVRACLPQAQHFLKCLSRLKATRGR